jgi:hypothetical protein
MARFLVRGKPATIETVQKLLSDRGHWRKGRSAYELAHSWIDAEDGVPKPVRDVLDRCSIYRRAELVDAHFEHATDLRSVGAASETDLLVHLKLADGGSAVIAVEGKAGESFGPIIRAWLNHANNVGDGKQRRLESLCKYFGLGTESVLDLRYQLLHRTAAAMFEAERCKARQAMVLIHSFAQRGEDFADYQKFLEKLEIVAGGDYGVTESREIHDIELRFAWVADRASA